MSTAEQRSTEQRSSEQRTTDQRSSEPRNTDQRGAQQHHSDARTTARQARHRADVEILTDLAHLPAWAAEVPDRGYYDAEVRSPEWVRARRQGLLPEFPERPAADQSERGRVYPTTYRENFVLSV